MSNHAIFASPFTYTICDPLNPNLIEKGAVTPEEFRNVLNVFPWLTLLRSMDSALESEIYFSPSLGLKNIQTNHELSVSIVGPEDEMEYYIFYIRPKMVTKKKWFKTYEELDPKFLSDNTGQTAENVLDAFEALLNEDYNNLETRWG